MASFAIFAIRSEYKVIVFFFLFVGFFYIEFVFYWTLPAKWTTQPECLLPQCKKILLVADPQIIGPEFKRFFLLDILAIWDSDRYLKRTFVQAVKFLKPDVIIFLGDLIDQGCTASDSEYESYVRRINYLFKLPNSLKNIKVVFLPGDNDIGGEDADVVPKNLQRFNTAFNQTNECDLVDFMEFCKVNLITNALQESKFISGDLIRIALSHIPIVAKHSYRLKEIVKKIRPSLIFSGHKHTSFHYAANENDVWIYKESPITPEETSSKTYKFHEGLIYEITVPTCTYRMGVDKMGYGAAFIDNNKKLMHYNVLWLPHRFKQLLIYSMAILPVIILIIMKLLKRSMRCRQK